jgi:Putative MetA-pathway of phenol degradation
LTDRWELDAEVPYRFRNFNPGRSFNGIGDVEAGARYGVIPLNKGPVALDVGLALGIPTGDRKHDLGEGRLTLEPSFTASTWFGPINTQLNCAWDRAVSNAGDEPRDEFLYNVAILYPVGRCVLALEGNGISTRDATDYYVTPELIWKPIPRLELLVAAPIGVTRDAADYGIVASVTLELDNITHREADKD